MLKTIIFTLFATSIALASQMSGGGFTIQNSYAVVKTRPADGDRVRVQVRIQFWERKQCRTGECDLPQASAAPMGLDVTLNFNEGGANFTSRAFEANGIRADIEVFVRDGIEPYVATQTRLTEVSSGMIIGECSRYDFVTPRVNPVGACSGVSRGTQYGVTISKL